MLAVEQKLLLLLEEIKEQGNTTINLLQQLVRNREGEGSNGGLDFQLPLSTVEEFKLAESQAEDGDVKGRLVKYVCNNFKKYFS